MPRGTHADAGAFADGAWYVLSDADYSANNDGATGPWTTEFKAKMVAALNRKKGRKTKVVSEEELLADDFEHPFVDTEVTAE